MAVRLSRRGGAALASEGAKRVARGAPNAPARQLVSYCLVYIAVIKLMEITGRRASVLVGQER